MIYVTIFRSSPLQTARHFLVSLRFPLSKPPITSSCRWCLWAGLSAQVKGLLDASEQQTQTISVLGNVGLWTNIVGGLVYDKYDDPKCPPIALLPPFVFVDVRVQIC